MRAFGLAVAIWAVGTAAFGQATLTLPDRPKGWTIDVGAGGVVSPDYDGSDDYEARALPYIGFNWRDRVYFNPVQGLGYNVVRNEDLRVGLLLRPRFGRDADDNRALSGFDDIDTAVEAGVAVEKRLGGGWTLGGRFTHDVSDVHDGAVGLLGLSHTQKAPLGVLVAGGELRAVDGDYNQSYFGVTPRQAASSGWSPYRAGGGLQSAGVNALLFTSIGKRGGLLTFVGYDRLLGDAADSPLVRVSGSPDQFRAGVFFAWRFSGG
jgi:outer membrane scaffolding protein for murein synthesis (MipA/OmpV family)